MRALHNKSTYVVLLKINTGMCLDPFNFRVLFYYLTYLQKIEYLTHCFIMFEENTSDVFLMCSLENMNSFVLSLVLIVFSLSQRLQLRVRFIFKMQLILMKSIVFMFFCNLSDN